MNDYLIHYNHNHDALGRFARSAGSVGSAVGSKITGKKEKKNTTRKYESTKRLATKKSTKAVEVSKQKGSKSNNTKLSDSDRKRLVESASLKEVTKNKDRLSNRELEKAIDRLQKEKVNRIDLEKKLYDLNKPDNQKNRESAMQKVERLGRNAETLANAINSGTKLYNNAAMVYNLGKPKEKQLPRIGDGKSPDKPRTWVQNIINSGDAVKAAKYADRMTADERKKVIDAIQDTNKINRMAEAANRKNTSSGPTINSSSGSSSKNSSRSESSSKSESRSTEYKSFFNEERPPQPESWKDVRDMMEPKAQENSSNRAEDILKNYPEYSSGESQKMSEEELKKKYKR